MVHMNRHTIIAIVVSVFAAFGAWVLYGAVSYMTYDVIGKTHILEEESQYIYRQHEAAKKVERVFEQTRDMRDVLRAQIIEGDDGILRLIDIIEDMGASANVEFTLNDIDKLKKTIEDDTEVSYLEISVATRGSWEDSITYVALLETYPWNIIVKEIDLQHDGEEGVWKGSHTFQLLNVIF
jgi:hypothetical protein